VNLSITDSSQIDRNDISDVLVYQNISKRALNRLTVLKSTIDFGKLFQMLTSHEVKECFLIHVCHDKKYNLIVFYRCKSSYIS